MQFGQRYVEEQDDKTVTEWMRKQVLKRHFLESLCMHVTRRRSFYCACLLRQYLLHATQWLYQHPPSPLNLKLSHEDDVGTSCVLSLESTLKQVLDTDWA